MRVFFNDELLVRKKYGYELTPKAESVRQDINNVITSLEKLAHRDSFDPSTVSSTVKVYGLLPQINTLMPKVIAKIRQEAPNLKVSLDSAPKRHFDALVAGDVHFALSSHQPPSSEQNIYRMVVAKRTFRLLMSRYHPLADLELTPERLAEFDFGQVSLQGEKRLSFEHKYQELGLANKKKRLSAPVQLNNFSSAPSIAAETEIIFHLPTPFAEAACQDPRLIVREVPAELQLDFQEVFLYWHKRFNDDPMCEWVREIFKQLYVGTDTLA